MFELLVKFIFITFLCYEVYLFIAELYTYFGGVNDKYFLLIFELSFLFVFNVVDFSLNFTFFVPLDVLLNIDILLDIC